MSKRFVVWTAIKNTEKSAIQNFGNEWVVKNINISPLNLSKTLVVPVNSPNDARWIFNTQIIGSRWETEPLNTTK